MVSLFEPEYTELPHVLVYILFKMIFVSDSNTQDLSASCPHQVDADFFVGIH